MQQTWEKNWIVALIFENFFLERTLNKHARDFQPDPYAQAFTNSPIPSTSARQALFEVLSDT